MKSVDPDQLASLEARSMLEASWCEPTLFKKAEMLFGNKIQ